MACTERRTCTDCLRCRCISKTEEQSYRHRKKPGGEEIQTKTGAAESPKRKTAAKH